MSASRPLRSSGLIASGTLLSRVTGLVRIWATGQALGITFSALADTYNSANSTPNLVYELVLGGVFTATLVPLFVDASERDDADSTSAVVTVAMVALVALTVIGVLAAPAIVSLLSLQVETAYRDDAIRVGTTLVRCFVPQIVGYGFTALAAAALNARHRFVAAAYAPVLNNILVTAVLLWVARTDPSLAEVAGDERLTLLLGIGTTAGILVTALALLPALRRAGVRLRFNFAPRHPAVVRMLRLSGWTFGYVAANQIALLFVMIIARDEAGTLAAYQYAFAFFQLPHGLVAVSIMTAWLPDLTARARSGDLHGMRERFDAGLRPMLLLMLPAAVGLLALSVPLVDTLLATGAGERPDTTAAALTGFAIGLVPFSVYLYTLRAFYALGDTRTPFLVNGFENLLNIALAVPLYARFGVRGLAAAYSVAYLGAAIVAVIALRRRIGPIAGRPVANTAVVASLAALACGGAAAGAAARFDTRALALVVGTLVGAAAYAAVLATFARSEVRDLLGRGTAR